MSKLPELLPLSFFYKGKWALFVVSMLIPILGLIFFNWDLRILIYLFWIELGLSGLTGVLHIIFDHNASFSLGINLRKKLALLLFFIPLFIGLMLLVNLTTAISYNEFNTYLVLYPAFDLSIVAMIIFYIFIFIYDFIKSESFKTGNRLFTIVKTLIYSIPIAILILFVILPSTKNFSGASTFIFLGVGIIVGRILIEGLGRINKRLFGNVFDEQHTEPLIVDNEDDFQFR